MKKLIIIAIAALSFNAATAQNRNGNYNKRDRYPQTQTIYNGGNNHRGQWNDRGYNNNRRDNGNDQYNRQAGYDRMNRECDQQIQVYRNDRSINQYERQRRINAIERGRQQQTNAFGKGLVVGGLAAILVGVLISK